MNVSWITVIWSMTASASLTLAAIHLLTWGQNRSKWAHLLFSLAAIGTAGAAFAEFCAMRAETTRELGSALRWGHLPFWVMFVSLVGFVMFYMRAGRLWLAWTICGLRTLSVILNFVFTPNINYREITALRHVRFFGESAAAPMGIPNPWMLVGQTSLLLFLVFLVDVILAMWRRGERRSLLTLGSAMVFFIAASMGQAVLSFWGIKSSPITPSLFFLGVVVAMAYELSREAAKVAQMTDDLRESEERIDLAADSAGVGIWVWDYKTNLLWATERARILYGFSSDEPLSFEKILSRLHADDLEWVVPASQKCMKEGADFRNDYRIVMPDGSIRWLKVLAKSYQEPSGRPDRMLGASLDITERKQAEEKLLESAAVLREAAEAAQFGVYRYGFADGDAFYSPELLALYGLPGDATLELDPDLVPKALHPDDKATLLKCIRAANDPRGSGILDIEFRIFHPDGKMKWLRMRGRTLFSKDGPDRHPLRSNGIIQDITERKRTEQEIAQQRNDLAHLSRVTTLSELSGSLAHELNQPLAIILTNAQAARRLLAQKPPDLVEVQEILSDIVSEDERAGEVIKRLRSLLKHGETSLQPLDVHDIIREVLRLVSGELLKDQITVQSRFADSTPHILGDYIQLQQVLLNLILNANDAMVANPPGGRQLTIETAHSNGVVRISVSDTGCGLPPAAERVFEPFYTTKKHGLGLGLSICHSIITAHQGRLWAEPGALQGIPSAGAITGCGATFHLDLPAAEVKL